MVIYNAFPRKEYERILMCNMEKEIWKTLLITHQGNSQVKDNKIDLLVQQYEQFVIYKDESIYSAFARFNTVITSLKAFDEGYSSKNHVKKFLRALHPKCRAKVMTIEELKDLMSLSLDDLIRNLKRKILETTSERQKDVPKKPRRKNGKSDRKCFTCGDPNHLIRECPKPPKAKNQRAFVGGFWSDSSEEDDEKLNNETCLVAQVSSEGPQNGGNCPGCRIVGIGNSSSTVVRCVELHIIVMIAKQGMYPSMIRVLVKIKILAMTSLYSILWISNNSLIVVRSVEVSIIALFVKPGTSLSMSLLLSSVDDLIPILKESELTLDSIDLECSMPIDLPLPCTDVLGDTIVVIDLLLGQHLDTLSTGDRKINFNPIKDIEELEHLLADDPALILKVFDAPLGNSDSMPRSYDVIFSYPLFEFNDDYTLCYDNPLFDEELKDISSMDPL
nr:hypothetical protein [Tanacetum cinerariifolium]